jgi:hypothetical protein
MGACNFSEACGDASISCCDALLSGRADAASQHDFALRATMREQVMMTVRPGASATERAMSLPDALEAARPGFLWSSATDLVKS